MDWRISETQWARWWNRGFATCYSLRPPHVHWRRRKSWALRRRWRPFCKVSTAHCEGGYPANRWPECFQPSRNIASGSFPTFLGYDRRGKTGPFCIAKSGVWSFSNFRRKCSDLVFYFQQWHRFLFWCVIEMTINRVEKYSQTSITIRWNLFRILAMTYEWVTLYS